MTVHSSCESLRDDMVALLYDDGEPVERARARDHLAACLSCRSEYAEFKSLRRELAGWALPPATFAPPARPGRQWLPAGLAAAAGLVLGIGVSMAGRAALQAPAPGPDQAAAGRVATAPPLTRTPAARFVSYDELQELLESQENRHQADLASLRESLTRVSESVAQGSGPLKSVSSVSPAVIEKLLKESEARQAQLVEARLAGLRTQTDLQRQYDMAQIAAGLAYIDSRTGADAARTSELMKNLVRVTAKPQDR